MKISEVYRASVKERDIFWNVYVARPLAAVLVYLLAKTPITPNQVSFLGAAIFVGVAVVLILVPQWYGMLIAALILQLSYLFDCADGQLARLTGMTSEVGAYLDFLIDEFKALLLVSACAVRLWLVHEDVRWLLVGLGGAMLVSIATSLTTFVRRPEYAGRTIRHGVHEEKPIPSSLVGKALWVVERLAQWLVHYPSWFHYVALLGILEAIDAAALFLYLFLGVYTLYVGKTGLGIVLKLGRPSFYDKRPE